MASNREPKTPGRSFRIPDDLYHAAMAKAHGRGTTLTAVIVRLLRDWLAED